MTLFSKRVSPSGVKGQSPLRGYCTNFVRAKGRAPERALALPSVEVVFLGVEFGLEFAPAVGASFAYGKLYQGE